MTTTVDFLARTHFPAGTPIAKHRMRLEEDGKTISIWDASVESFVPWNASPALRSRMKKLVREQKVEIV